MDSIELNHAFSAQSLAFNWTMGFDDLDERSNSNFSATTLGHPLGCDRRTYFFGRRARIAAPKRPLRPRDHVHWCGSRICLNFGKAVIKR